MRLDFGGSLAVAVLVGGAFAACTPLPPYPPSPPGAPPAYEAGKFFGCEFGFMEAGWDQYSHIYYKDIKRLEEDDVYREGWEAGYAMCFKEGSRYLEMSPGAGGGSLG
jgi:hypothetical protein